MLEEAAATAGPTTEPEDHSHQRVVRRKKSAKKKQAQQAWKLSDFEIGRSLGSGKFGNVYLARSKKEKKVVAMKVIFMAHIKREGLVHQLKREIETHARIRHKNCCRLYGWFKDAKRIYLVMRFAEHGDFYKFMKEQPHGRVDQPRAMRYVRQLAAALVGLHKYGIIHRDIKPENLLLGADDQLLLADFGWTFSAPGKIARHTLCGTLDYLPPEMIEDEPYDTSVDCWMLGVLAYELVVGRPPFEAETQDETYDRILEARVEFPEGVHAGVQDLIRNILVKDPKARFNTKQIMEQASIVIKVLKEEQEQASSSSSSSA